jgi:hypothetical protein
MVNHAENYGLYTAPARSSNTAILLEVKRHVKEAWGLDFGFSIAGDFGTQYGNVFGAMICISKRGVICNW